VYYAVFPFNVRKNKDTCLWGVMASNYGFWWGMVF